MTSMVVLLWILSACILLYLLVAFDIVNHFLSLVFIPHTLGTPPTSVIKFFFSVIFVDLIPLYTNFNVAGNFQSVFPVQAPLLTLQLRSNDLLEISNG